MSGHELDLLRLGALAGEERKRRIIGEERRQDEPAPACRTRRCQRCRQIYDEKPRSQAETERLQHALLITGPGCHADLAFCDICYEQVVETPTRRNNNSSFDIGSSNCGPANWLLQSKYGR